MPRDLHSFPCAQIIECFFQQLDGIGPKLPKFFAVIDLTRLLLQLQLLDLSLEAGDRFLEFERVTEFGGCGHYFIETFA